MLCSNKIDNVLKLLYVYLRKKSKDIHEHGGHEESTLPFCGGNMFSKQKKIEKPSRVSFMRHTEFTSCWEAHSSMESLFHYTRSCILEWS